MRREAGAPTVVSLVHVKEAAAFTAAEVDLTGRKAQQYRLLFNEAAACIPRMTPYTGCEDQNS